jgi:hypothetical protein
MAEVIHINQKRVGIHEYGDKNGFPVFYFHGFWGSRLEAVFSTLMSRQEREMPG